MAVVIVTGASRGLGAAIAISAAELGADVVLCARSTNNLESVAAQIRSGGGTALVVPGDISNFAYCQYLVGECIRHFGRIDSLVNNAAIVEPIAPIVEAGMNDWQSNLAVNFLGPVALIQAALPQLRESGGRIINVSSGVAVTTIAGSAAYSSAKAALNHFTRILAIEEPKVTAITLRPGVIDTDMQEVVRQEGKQGMPAETHARFVAYQKKGELLPPDVPGRAAAKLALYAPLEWSGEFITWNDDRVQNLGV
jgi:NAD(P)-dependent dehydrogenase (short-subunit alcohol dehydrogenase family)